MWWKNRKSSKLNAEVIDVFIRMNSGETTDEDREFFNTWSKENPGLLVSYHELEYLWKDLGVITQQLPLNEIVKPDPQLTDVIQTNKIKKKSWAVWSIAAAVAVICVLSIFLFTNQQIFYKTDRGERLVVNLSDGSRIQLNSMTRINVDLNKGARIIELVQGEALFNVDHDADRKFIVKTERGDVEAIGTEFNISLLAGNTTVTVLEGTIQLSLLQQDKQIMKPAIATVGDQLRISNAGKIETIADTEIEQVIAWTKGQLIFSGESLAQAIAKVNFHSKHNITVTDSRLTDLPVFGVFNTGDPQGFLSAIEEIYPLRPVEISEKTTLLMYGAN